MQVFVVRMKGCYHLLRKEGERVLSYIAELMYLGIGNECIYSLHGISTHGQFMTVKKHLRTN